MKRVVSKITFSKICSVVTAVCFLASTIGSNLYASATPLTVSSCDDIFNSMSVIKQECGKVTAVQDSSSDITVVNIQDLHCHEQTQRNISEIIKTLDKNYSLKSVFIEGGYGQIDVSWINKVQDETIRNSIIEKMLQSGYLTGAEYYAVKNSKYDLLKGIEEKDIHQANLDRLSKIIEKQPQYISVASKVNKEIEVLSNIHLNEKNKRFSRKISDYRKGKTDTLKFYRLLSKYVEKINSFPEQYNNIIAINLEDYPNFSKYIDISQQSKDTNPRQVSIELQTLINIIKNKIPYSSYKKLLDITNNFSDTEKLVEFLTKFSDMYDIDLSKDFKELNNFFTANRLNQNLNPIELVNEERKLIEQIRMALSYDNTEYEISYISDFSMYFEDYLTYSLTSADWKYLKQDFEKFRLLYSKYATVDRIKEIASDINFINDYYDTNDSRNDIFVSNILRNENPQQNLSVLRTSDEILKQSREVFVVITGGYHSEALKSIFADRKVNTVVITPNVTGNIQDADQKYNRIIEYQKAVEYNALALRLASCLPDENQKNLMAKVALDILGKDKLEQIRALVGQDIDISKIENIQVDEQKKSEIISLIQTAVNSLATVLPSQAGQKFFNPDIDSILTEMSLKLYDMGFYFENGAVYEIDSSEYKGKDLIGIPAEVYSRMFGSLQKGLLAVQQTEDKKTQLSIFDALKNKNAVFAFLAKTAPVWEEIVFRAIPSLITVFNPVLGISLFAVSQIVFLFSHTIVKWIVSRDSAGNRLAFSGILKDDLKNLTFPSLVLLIPYILTMFISPVFLPIATISAIIIHSLNNKLSIFGSYNNVQVKNQFELKLPFEELGIKPGDKVLITYLGDGSLLFSRNIKEINTLFESLSAQMPEKRDIYQRYIYPNTFEFTVKKGGIVNIKQLADSLIRKKQGIEGENGVKLFYRIEPLQEPDEEKTKESDLQPNEDKKEQQTESDENRFASEAIISDELIKKLEPAKVIELDFSKFIDFEGENDNSEAINSYIREIIANNDLRNAFITLTFSKLYGTNLDENKIKTVNRILSVLSDEIDGIFTDKIGNVAGVSFFEDILENAFVHGNNLSLNKKIFIYFGNDRDVIVINSNTPQNKTIESLAFASKLNLYGFGSGIKSAEKVSNARYSVTDIVMPDKTKIELYVAYITFRKYQQLKRTLLDKALKKINTSAIWQTTETKNIERQYAYAEIPVLEEGESVFATNFVKGGSEYSGDWVEFKISKKNGAYFIYDVSKRENKFKWYMPYEAQIPLEEKLEVVEENGKFYIRSNYTGIRVLKTQADQGLEKEIDPSVSPQKTEPSEQDNVLSQQEAPTGNYEFERLFRLVHRDSNLKPVIGDSKSYEYRLQLQKLCYALADKLDLDEIEELYRDNEEKLRLAGYLRILKFKRINDNESLQAIVYNNGLDIKYRLMAYMYLRSNGINDFSDRILEIMKENFISGLTSGSFKIDNNFDLSVLGAGILLVLNKYLVQNKYIDQQQEKNLYENISYSTFVDKSELEGTSANSGMFFTSPDPLTMAHEIGHRVLLFYMDSSKGVAYSTIHEIFAGVISAVFAEKAGIGSKYYEDALYELFNTKMQYDYVLQEEHKASRGLFYTVTEIAKQMGKTVKFEILADAVINLIKTNKVLPKRQSDTIKELLTEYMNMLRFKDNYTQEDIAKFEELLREESWKSKVLELFMNLRGASGRNWDYYGTKYKKIMDGMRMHVAETESYRHGILEIDYRDDLVVINNIIMSQPEKVNMVLQIVKDELSQSDYLLRPEIAKLIFADLVISLPQMKDLSKYQLDRLIQDIVDKFFSDKVDYKSSEIDYQKIRVYALEEYIFFKIFVPRKFGGKSLANINSITSGKYIERIHDDRHDYSYAESLPPVVPSIDTFFMHLGLVRLYRHIFEVLTKKMVKSKNSLKLSKSMEDYLDIYKIKDNNRALAKVIYNDKLSLKHRLFAFMYLKINGGNVEDPVVINNIKREFAQAIHKNKLQIRNNFDLRAVVTGVYLLLEDFSKEYVSKEKYTETYKSISKAVVLRRGKESVGARANMTFVSVSPLTIAHELGHRILSSSSDTFVDDVTIHELFAYTISNMFKKIVDVDEQEYEYALYSLFNKSANYDEVFQNEHQASKGLISLLKSVSNHIGKDVKWDILADAIIAYVLSSPERVKESNQGTNLRNIFIEYLTQLDAEKHYSRYDLREMFAFAKNVTSGETVLIDILANIKETDRKQYDVILKQMQEKIKPHKSYMKGFLLRMLHSKSKIKEFSDIIKELLGIKPEYRDDTEIINKIIFSQPIQVKNISQIIRAQILRKQEYTKQDFENLIKAEFLFQYNGKYYSKEELDAFMQNVVQNILSIVGNDTFHQHYNTYGYGDYLEAKSYIAQQKARTLQTNKTVEILNGLGNSLYSEKNKAENFRYSVIGIAIGVVLETFSFWMPGFIKQHENPTKTMIVTTWGIRILSVVLAITSGFIFVPIAVPVVLIAVEWITHFVYNLFEIKRMNKNIIVQFEAVDTLNTTGNIADDSVIPVLLLKDIKNADTNRLINTGLKVNGETIWQIDVKDSVVFVASDTDVKDLALVLNGSKTLEKRLRKILNLNNINLNVENSVIVDEKTEETYFQNSVAVVNNNKYVQPMINAFKSISFMYSQKTIISLEKVPNNKLYQALINGKARKIITAEQFEYIKQLLQQENKSIEQEILNLRMNGVEIYVKENELTDKYKEYGIIGLLLGGEIYDYYTDEKIEIEIVDSKITLQELESKLINSDKPLLMDIISLQNIFKSTRSIVGAYSGLEALIGNIKIKFGFKNIKARDMENFAHSIDMNDIPDVINDDVNKMFAGDIFNFSGILNLDDGNIISIILNDVNVSEQAKQLFLNTIKERILLKNIQQNREKELNLKYSKYGLKDKKLENLLGKALYLKMQFAGEQSIDLQKDIDNKLNNLTPAELMGKITELSQKAFAGRDPVAIATIIELIMICAEEYRNDDIGSLTKKDLLREYKSMLSAA